MPLAAALVACAACRGERRDERIFLVDVAARGGLPAVAELGQEQRPVLFRSGSLTLAESTRPILVPDRRELIVPVTLPEGFGDPASRPAKVLLLVGDRLERLDAEIEPAPGKAWAIRLRFELGDVGKPLRYTVFLKDVVPPASPTLIVGPVRIPRAARLRLSIGIEADRCAGHPLTDLRIDVIPRGRGKSLYRRRLDPATACDRWLPVDLPLGDLQGRTVSFRFRARAVRAADRDARPFVLWGDPIVAAPGDAEGPPNIILISLDTLAAKHLGAYGHRAATSPFFDGLVDTGTLFERALSHYPSTAGSHMSLFTAQTPARHGVRGIFDRLALTTPTLPQAFRHAGYLTAAVTEDATLAQSMGFERGFHVYWENRDPLVKGTGAVGRARQTFARGLRWLRRRPTPPFFLFLHTYQVHAPYTPQRRYLRLVRDGSADRRDPAARYDAEIRFLDHLLDRFIGEVARLGLLERTVVMITADHGEAFGEHGAWMHSNSLYDEVMHVPLLLLGPRIPHGLRVERPVGLVDIAPTLLDLAGIQPPASFEGRSLLPVLRGGLPDPRPVVAELRGAVAGDTDRPNLRAVWLGTHKVIWDVIADRWQVFDLARDPLELHDLGTRGEPVRARAREILAAYETPVAAEADDGRQAAPPVLTQEAIDKLRALGYVQ